MRSKQRRRRRPGESWSLWRVTGRHRTTGKPAGIGYLVTDRERRPNPIALVRGVGKPSLRMAKLIERNPNAAAREFAAAAVRDLRPIPGRTFPKALLNWLLIPVDRLGRRIANARTFIAGIYRRYKWGPFYPAGVIFEAHCAGSPTVAAALGKREKRPLESHTVHTLGGNKSGGAKAQSIA